MLTLADVQDALGAVEPEYPTLAAEFGAAAIPFLRQLAVSDDIRIATKAVHLAALLGDEQGVAAAATQPYERVQIAAVAAATDLPVPAAGRILSRAAADPRPAVRAVAGRYIGEYARIRDWIRRSGNTP